MDKSFKKITSLILKMSFVLLLLAVVAGIFNYSTILVKKDNHENTVSAFANTEKITTNKAAMDKKNILSEKTATDKKTVSSDKTVTDKKAVSSDKTVTDKKAVSSDKTVTDKKTVSSDNVLSYSKKAAYIAKNTKIYSSELRSLAVRNKETVDFVYDYPNLKKKVDDGSIKDECKITDEEMKSNTPLLLQWDKRWGAYPYGVSFMALSGCGPACISMVAVSLTKDKTITPDVVADYAMEAGYYIKGSGTSWSLMSEGGNHYGLTCKNVSINEAEMKKTILSGEKIICSVKKGDFTKTGHFIVIYDYKDGMFKVNDPNSIKNSNKSWSFKRLSSQIRNMWAYKKA